MSGRMSGLVFSESGLSIYFDVSSSALVLSAWSTPIFPPEPLWKKLCGWCHYFHKPRFVRRRVLCANVTIDYRCLPELWKTICSTILSHSLNRQLSAKVHSRIFWNRVREVLSFDIGDKNNSFHWICTWGKKKNLDQSNYRERWQTSDGVLQLKEADNEHKWLQWRCVISRALTSHLLLGPLWVYGRPMCMASRRELRGCYTLWEVVFVLVQRSSWQVISVDSRNLSVTIKVHHCSQKT